VSAITVDAPIAPSVQGGSGMVQISGLGVGASSYEILRSTDLVNYSVVASGLPTASYDDNTAVNGTNYYYQIRATYSDGSQQTSPPSAGVTPGITPQAPGQLFLVDNSTGSSVVLTWAKVGGASDYLVYFGNTSGGPYPSTQISTGNTVSISGLVSGTDHFFVVRSRVGLIESANSAELAVSPNTSMAAPTLTAQGNAIGVSWTAVAGASRYNLLRSVDSVYFTTLVSGTTSTNYTDASVTSGTAYYYQLIPFAANNSNLGPSVVGGPIEIDDPVPASGLVAESVSGTAVKLTWTMSPSQRTTAYQVYRSTTSGGPYSLIQTTGSTIQSYLDIDAALTSGLSYYYVVRAVNNYSQQSLPTNEVAIRLSAGPTLGIYQTNGVMNLSWPAVGGASQYNIYRSQVAGGPYGLIANTSSLSYQDSTVVNGVTYYYVTTAVFANGDKSVYSNEVNQLVVKTMNLRVPIELIDQGLASDTSPSTFERSRTSLETTSYDGVVTYDFEIVATNIGGTNSLVSLVDETDNVVAQVTVLANSTLPVRVSNTLTPIAGFHTYRLRLAATTNASDVQVYSGKVWVNQVGATRTKLYFPLLSPVNSTLNGDLFAPIESTANTNLTVLNNSDEFVRDVTNLAKIPDYNGWEFESVVSTFGSHGLISLYNETTGQPVKSTETIFSDSEVTLFNSSFDEGKSEFASANHLNKYKVAFRCYLDCELGPVNVYKSGLWVKLENMTQAEILVRQSTSLNNISVTAYNDRFRTMLDLSNYSNPSAYFRANAKASNMGDNGNIQVVSNGTGLAADAGFANLSLVTNSSINFNESNYTTKQTPSPLTINNQDRFMTEILPSNGGLDIRSSYIVIRASP
jgi:fibronectin type 3 domain-containing protein